MLAEPKIRTAMKTSIIRTCGRFSLLLAGLGSALWAQAAPVPVAHWTFDDGTANDGLGAMHGTLNGGATIANGRLVLNGTDAFVKTAPLSANVSARTLVVKVALATLDQGGGGVMTLQTGDGNVFDSIVFAERQARKWVSGSDNWSRTADVIADEESASPTELVQLAIVYGADNSIALYRNGQPYGAPYTPGSGVRTYPAASAHVLFGMRHGLAPTGNRMFNGEIDEAMLFDRALSPAEIGTLAGRTLFIWREPQPQFVFIGQSATFTVGAAGTEPLNYQWMKGDEALAGQTATNLVLANVQATDAGDYRVRVSNSSGAITSVVARLRAYRPVENNLVGHWKLDDLDGLVTTNATGNDLTGSLVEFTDNTHWNFGVIEGALGFLGTRRVVIEDSPLLRPDSFSVAFWLQPNNLGFDGTPISKESATHCETWGLELRGSGQLNFFLFNNAGFIADVQSSENLAVGFFHHVVLSYNHVTSTPEIYLDGALVSGTRGRGPASGAPGYDSSPLTFGRRLGQCAYPQSFDGLLDDVQLYDKAMNSSEATFLFLNPGAVLNPNVNLPPAVTIPPQSQTVLVGSTATFNVTAEGTPPLRYQWLKDDAPLAGQTNATLTLANVALGDAGAYTVAVSSHLGSTTSAAATLRVVEFGSGELARWTFDDGTASDGLGSMHGTLQGGAVIANGRLVLDGTSAFVETAALPSTVTEKTLVAWVALTTLEQGGGGVITLEEGPPGDRFDSIVYAERQPRKWMAGSDFWRRTADVAGAAETAGPGVLVHLAIVYKGDNSIALFRNGQPYGEPYTQGVLQTYNAGAGKVLLGRRHTGATLLRGEIDEASLYDRALLPAEISGLVAMRNFRWEQQPADLMALAGSAASLTAMATSDTPVSYQWYKNSGVLAGESTRTLAWASLQSGDAGSYYVVASSGGLQLTSRVARVRVRLAEENGLLARWTFDDGTARDVYGLMDGTLLGGATITDGRLVLNGVDAYVRTAPLPLDVTAKTLVAWVSPGTLDQGGGGVLTLQTGDGNVFDAIVFAEQQPRIWMAGSDNWNRTQAVGGTEETAGPGDFVVLAIVYGTDSITIYRNGQPYGSPYTKGGLMRYVAGNGEALLGLRHAFPAGNRLFNGQVDEARLYDRALTAEEVAGLGAPRLQIIRTATTVTLSWPAEFTEYELETADSLPATSWNPVPGVVNNSVTLDATESRRFFQLRKP
jgi:hypothetical protein